MIETFDDKVGTVIEVNKAPAFLLNYYPAKGEPQNPFAYIFKSLILEDKVLKNVLSVSDISKEDFNILLQRYKFLYNKQLDYERIIKQLENEIEYLQRF